MWEKLHNPIFYISVQNITVHALQENCNNKKKKTTEKPTQPTTKNEPHTKKKILTQSKLLLHILPIGKAVIQPVFTMKERTGKQLETISQLLCELCLGATEVEAVNQ